MATERHLQMKHFTTWEQVTNYAGKAGEVSYLTPSDSIFYPTMFTHTGTAGTFEPVDKLRLKKSAIIYVDTTSGVDELTGGRGFDAHKPFKTIYYAWQWASAHIDLGVFQLTFHLAPGTYDTSKFNTTMVGFASGTAILFDGRNNTNDNQVYFDNGEASYLGFAGSKHLMFRNIHFKGKKTAIINLTWGVMAFFYGCKFEITDTTAATSSDNIKDIIIVQRGAVAQIYTPCEFIAPTGYSWETRALHVLWGGQVCIHNSSDASDHSLKFTNLNNKNTHGTADGVYASWFCTATKDGYVGVPYDCDVKVYVDGQELTKENGDTKDAENKLNGYWVRGAGTVECRSGKVVRDGNTSTGSAYIGSLWDLFGTGAAAVAAAAMPMSDGPEYDGQSVDVPERDVDDMGSKIFAELDAEYRRVGSLA